MREKRRSKKEQREGGGRKTFLGVKISLSLFFHVSVKLVKSLLTQKQSCEMHSCLFKICVLTIA